MASAEESWSCRLEDFETRLPMMVKAPSTSARNQQKTTVGTSSPHNKEDEILNICQEPTKTIGTSSPLDKEDECFTCSGSTKNPCWR